MGHEAFGTIESVGEDVDPGRIGQLVVVEPNLACLVCEECRRGRTSACVSRESVGMNRQGALAELLVVPARYAWPMSGEPEDLVCVEPTTVVLAALRRLGTPPPASVLVVGVGAQGLLMSLALGSRGVDVLVHDVNPDRVTFATRTGARPVATGDGDAGFDLVVDTVGSPASVEVALARVGVAGTLLLLGLDSRPWEVTAQTIVRRQLVIRGSLTYDHPGDFETAIALIGDKGFSPGRTVSTEYALEDVQAAFDRSGTAVGKTWIRVAGSDKRS
jgi:alcohol dehydrogenase/L-iditol 2-dehydrogenase